MHGNSYCCSLHDVVYLPLVGSMVDDLQDFIWSLILSIQRIVNWDLLVLLVSVTHGYDCETGTEFYSALISPVDDEIIRHELNSHKCVYWWWT